MQVTARHSDRIVKFMASYDFIAGTHGGVIYIIIFAKIDQIFKINPNLKNNILNTTLILTLQNKADPTLLSLFVGYEDKQVFLSLSHVRAGLVLRTLEHFSLLLYARGCAPFFLSFQSNELHYILSINIVS